MKRHFRIGNIILCVIGVAIGSFVYEYFAPEEPKPSELEVVISQIDACAQMKRAIDSAMAEAAQDQFLLDMNKDAKK